MKRVLFSAMIITFSVISMNSFGQDSQPDPGARAKKISEKMKTELSLSEDQYKKVYDINLAYSQKMTDLRNKTSEDRNDKMNSFRELNKNRNEELKAVLSADQMSKYQDMQKEMKQKAREHRKDH